MVVANRIAEHVEVEQGTGRTVTPSLVKLRYSVKGKCAFHIARVRKGLFQIRVGRSADAILNFRYWPDYMEDDGDCKAWRRLRIILQRQTGKTDVKFKLEDLECSEDAMWMAERVGCAINAWRLANGRSDFPSAALVAQAVKLPEAMVKVALRDYERDAD